MVGCPGNAHNDHCRDLGSGQCRPGLVACIMNHSCTSATQGLGRWWYGVGESNYCCEEGEGGGHTRMQKLLHRCRHLGGVFRGVGKVDPGTQQDSSTH